VEDRPRTFLKETLSLEGWLVGSCQHLPATTNAMYSKDKEEKRTIRSGLNIIRKSIEVNITYQIKVLTKVFFSRKPAILSTHVYRITSIPVFPHVSLFRMVFNSFSTFDCYRAYFAFTLTLCSQRKTLQRNRETASHLVESNGVFLEKLDGFSSTKSNKAKKRS